MGKEKVFKFGLEQLDIYMGKKINSPGLLYLTPHIKTHNGSQT